VYDDQHLGDHVAVVLQYAAPPAPDGRRLELFAAAWLPPARGAPGGAPGPAPGDAWLVRWAGRRGARAGLHTFLCPRWRSGCRRCLTAPPPRPRQAVGASDKSVYVISVAEAAVVRKLEGRS
jgi:hypothetical protein